MTFIYFQQHQNLINTKQQQYLLSNMQATNIVDSPILTAKSTPFEPPPVIAVTPSLSIDEDDDQKVPHVFAKNKKPTKPTSPCRRQELMRKRNSDSVVVHIYSNL